MSEVKSADICWGQRYHWLRYQQVPAGTRHDAHIVANCPLPEGITLSALRSALNHLVRRHEALRTVFDPTARPWPQQRVHPPGPLDLRVVTTESDGSATPADTVAALTRTDFDLATQWPIRVCVVTTAGLPRRLVVVLNHVAFDDWSLTTFRDEFESVVAAAVSRARASLPPVLDQPADLARHEAQRPPSVVSLEHWRTELAQIPADPFAHRRRATSALESDRPAHSASLTSPSLLASARDIAARLQVWPSVVHLAAYAVMTAAYAEQPHVVYRWLTSHREASAHMGVMTCMFSPTLVSVDLADDPPFSEVVRRTAARVQSAQAHAYVAYDEIVERVSREGTRRGQPLRIAADVNFLSYAPRTCGTRRDRFAWNAAPVAWARAGSDVYFRIHEWQDGVTVGLLAAGSIMDKDAVERFLRGFTALVDAHQDPCVDLSVTAASARAGFARAPERATVRVGPDPVDLAAIATVLRAHPAVATADVRVADGALLADVVVTAALSPSALRTHVLSVVHDVPGTRCPDRFVVSGAGPALEGDGRADGAAGTVAEQALAAAVAAVNGLGDVDLTGCYSSGGGRVMRAPGVVATLAERGWAGVTVDHLTGARPLRVLAGALQRTH